MTLAADMSNVENAVRLVKADGQTLIAILDNAYDAVVTEQLLDDNGGEETLTFSMPFGDAKVGLIKNEMLVHITRVTHDPAVAQATAIEGVYVVRTITKGYDSQGFRVYSVYCEARWYDLATDDLITVDPAVNTAGAAIAAILWTTAWTVGVIGVPPAVGDVAWGSTDLVTPLASLRSLPAIFGGELVFDTINLQVSLIPRRGDANPHMLYIRGANMSSDIRTTDTTGLVTRVHPLGSNDIDITSVNNNVPFVEDYSYFDRLGLPRAVRAQLLTNDAISDPQALLAWATNQLVTLSQPMNRWDIGISLLAGKAIPHLGDLVRVNDQSMGLDTYARVSRREFNIVQPWLSTLVVDTAAYTLATPTQGGTGLPPGSAGTDHTIPNPPTALTLTFGSGLDGNGNWNTYGIATWQAPTANSDGTPISDFDHYDLEVLPFGQGTWTPVGATSATSAGFGYIPSNHPVSVRVRTVDHTYNRSAWVTVTVDVPLPTPFYRPPSTPVLDADTLPLCIQVVWNGLDNNNVPYPQDVDIIEVHLAQTATSFTPTPGTLHSVVPAQLGGFVEPLTGLTPGVAYTVELVASGRSDTKSLPSVAVTATVLPVGPTHLVYNGDQDNIIPDGSFETAANRARILADASYLPCWTFVTAATAPGGAAGIAHGQWALRGTGGTLTGQERGLALCTAASVEGQKVWAKIKYWNTTTGGLAWFSLWCFDSTGASTGTPGITLPANSGYQTAAQTITLPTGTVRFQVLVYMDAAVSAGNLLIDAAECRTVTQTAIIDQLAVTDAQIASASVSKLTVGSLLADVTLSARIKTANSGARLEMNSTGLFAFNAGGTNTVAIRNDGTATFTGTVLASLITTAASGHRVTLDPSQPGILNLYSGSSLEQTPGYLFVDQSGSFWPYISLVGPTTTTHSTSPAARISLDGDPDGLGSRLSISGGALVAIDGAQVRITASGGYDVQILGGTLNAFGGANVTGDLTARSGQPVTTTPDNTARAAVCGQRYASTDASGYYQVPHGMTVTPDSVLVTPQYPIGGVANIPVAAMADSFTSSDFRVRLFDQTGAAYASKFATVNWFAVGN